MAWSANPYVEGLISGVDHGNEVRFEFLPHPSGNGKRVSHQLFPFRIGFRLATANLVEVEDGVGGPDHSFGGPLVGIWLPDGGSNHGVDFVRGL